MVQAVVGYVLAKLGEGAYQEALILYGVGEKVAWAKRELEMISVFLKNADAKAKQNLENRVKQWVKDVKEVAYMIDDALDNFLVDVGGVPKKLGVLKKIVNAPKILLARYRVSNQIDKIKKIVRSIKESAVSYGIQNLNDDGTRVTTAKIPSRLPVLSHIDKTDVVLGFELDKCHIIDRITDKINLTRSVISIVGSGGSGKSTLAKLVYNSDPVRNHFDFRMWITISKEYDLVDILKKLLKQITRKDHFNMQGLDTEDLVQEIRKFLLEKTYLVVLDDVWSTSLWIELQKVLPDNINGSRALITTRSKEVALEANPCMKPYEPQVLDKQNSLQLMLGKAFPNQFENECPKDLLDIANDFVKKCGGLPLALIVMGRILSKKKPDYNTWNDFLKKMKWRTAGKECFDIVSASYEELPLHLKECFMYFAVFPEDYQIKASSLKRLWIAEGFIPQEEIMEDTTESYLQELVNRCMVQVKIRSWNGTIKYCQLHDVLHELAIHKAQEFCLMVKSNSTDIPTSSSDPSTRRIVLRHGGTIPAAANGPNLRSLLSFDSMLPNCNELRMARVIHVERHMASSERHNVKTFKRLALLRYFHYERGIMDTTILSYRTPWKFLQTIDYGRANCPPYRRLLSDELPRELHDSF